MDKGAIHIYCGDGKGKTTAGMGLCLRAAGHGERVTICQFMKDNSSGERRVLAGIENVFLMEGPDSEKFSFELTDAERDERRMYYAAQLERAFASASETGKGVLFLDEVLYAIGAGLLDEELLIRRLGEKPEELEVILTGRDPSPKLMDMADYISEVRKVKHPFDKGAPARPGIEF